MINNVQTSATTPLPFCILSSFFFYVYLFVIYLSAGAYFIMGLWAVEQIRK
jgi:hypothetical protein